MKEILKEVFQKINWSSTIKSVTDKGTEKLIASAGVTSIASALGIHFQLLGIFFVLEVLDVLNVVNVLNPIEKSIETLTNK